MSESKFKHAARVAALSPSFPRNFSYPGVAFDHSSNAVSHSASLLNKLERSQQSSALTLLRGGSDFTCDFPLELTADLAPDLPGGLPNDLAADFPDDFVGD